MAIILIHTVCLMYCLILLLSRKQNQHTDGHKLKPVKFPESNLELNAPVDMPECGSLHVFHDKNKGVYISFWEIGKKQLKEIKKEGGLWIGIVASSHPPLFLVTKKPIEES